MDRKKHKRLNDTIMKPEDLKKSRIQKGGGMTGPSTSSASGGGIKAKLDFRSGASNLPKPNIHISSTAGPSAQSSHVVRPPLDEKWQEFGDSINLNLETFAKSIMESVELEKFNKVARMLVAALKSFLAEEKLKVEFRLIGTIAETIKSHGAKLNHVHLHRGLLYVLANSRSFPDNILQLFVSMTTCLAKQQPMLDKCYVAAFLHDAIGMNTGLGTANRCAWIEKPYSQELVKMIMSPFATIFPVPEMYSMSQVEGFVMSEYLPKERLAEKEHPEQLSIYLEFLKPWFDNIRGEVLPKPLFRALCLLAGFDHVRFFIASRLDVWITLQKFHREISELLLVLGCNIDANKDLDKDVIDILLKLNTKNMKTRTIAGPFGVSIRRACMSPVNVHAIFESLIINETGPAQNRSPANLPTMFMLLSCQPVEATTALAMVCAKELMRDKESCTKMLRGFLRELIRGFNHTKSGEFPFSVFASSFLNAILKRGIADEVPRLAVDLVTQIPLATISSLIVTREQAFSTKYSIPSAVGDIMLIPPEARIAKDKFQAEFVAYCEAVLTWLAKARRVIPDENSIIKCYSLLLYLEKQREAYTGMEVAAISDGELANVMRIFGECGVSEGMVLLLLEGSIPPKNIVEFTSSITQRAAQHHKIHSNPLIKMSDSFQLIDRLLAVSILPDTEVPRYEDLPPLCSKNLFWASWSSIILWMAGGELSEHFEKIYESSPILRYLVFCIMTKRFDFPLDFEGTSAEVMKSNEEAALATQRVVVGKYEKKMMRPPNSLNVYLFPGRTEFRAPQFLDDVRIFAGKFRLASKFTKCKTPPLLTRLVGSVGAENALYAVREMLAADAMACSMLSSECVFHALMYYFDNQRIKDTDQSTNNVMKALIRQAEANLRSTEPIENDFLLSSFITSLSSHSIAVRSAAVNVFSSLFPSSEDNAFDLVKMAKVPRFSAHRLRYMETLATAILVESDNRLANAYLQFLTRNGFVEKGEVHTVARAICHILSTDCLTLHSSLCHYFLQYLDDCLQHHLVADLKSLDDSLCCLEMEGNRVALAKEVPISIIKLLSKYTSRKEGKDEAFEALVKRWLSPGAIPKFVDPDGTSSQFLSLPMRKEMLKSTEQRVVDAALDELSEQDAQKFVLVSQMSTETAEKVIRKADNMNLAGIDRQSIANMYLIIRGYRMRGIEAGESLEKRLKEEVERAPAKDEPMEITEEVHNFQPSEFLREAETTLETMETTKMDTSDIAAWLKANCAAGPATKQKPAVTDQQFQLPPSFIRSAMNEEKSALACLQHIEANLKYFLSHEAAFQTLIVIIDSAANKFPFVQKRLENLAVRLLKSVSPPISVTGVLQKHASRASKPTSHQSTSGATTFAQLTSSIKGASGEREKRLIDEFMASFVSDKGELIEWHDVHVFIRSLRAVYSGGNSETTAERCLSNRWTSDLQRAVCSSLFERYHEHVCSIFVFRLLSSYCKKFPLASYNELFLTRNSKQQIVPNRKAYQSLAIYFSDVSNTNQEYDLRIVNLIVDIEKQGKVPAGLEFGTALIQASCANPKQTIRIASKRLLDSLSERLTYLSYKAGIASSIRVLTNVESRESCIRRCEQIVDRLVEMPMDPRLALSEDICEEERPTKVEEPKRDAKRPADPRDRRGGPPPKKGRFISAKDLPIVGGAPPPVVVAVEEPPVVEEPVKREWIATSQAMTRFLSLLREHPNIVKMKFPVLANFVSQLTTMNKKELRDENRIRKIELILQAVVSLCPFLLPEELSSVETALANCFEFYEKHLEDGGFGIREQTAFADLIVQAAAAYLNRSFTEARTFLRDNRQVAERVCKRSRDPRADVVLDNCDASSS